MSTDSVKSNWFLSSTIFGLLFWIVICFSAAFLTSSVGPDAWYRELNQPSITPPNWIFAPVWTALYTMMAVAAWLVWKDGGVGKAKWALLAFMVQLSLNAAWSWLFFRQHRIDLALVNIIALLIAIMTTTYLFYVRNRTAGVLMMPYLAWVSFATVLNSMFWWLNR